MKTTPLEIAILFATFLVIVTVVYLILRPCWCEDSNDEVREGFEVMSMNAKSGADGPVIFYSTENYKGSPLSFDASGNLQRPDQGVEVFVKSMKIPAGYEVFLKINRNGTVTEKTYTQDVPTLKHYSDGSIGVKITRNDTFAVRKVGGSGPQGPTTTSTKTLSIAADQPPAASGAAAASASATTNTDIWYRMVSDMKAQSAGKLPDRSATINGKTVTYYTSSINIPGILVGYYMNVNRYSSEVPPPKDLVVLDENSPPGSVMGWNYRLGHYQPELMQRMNFDTIHINVGGPGIMGNNQRTWYKTSTDAALWERLRKDVIEVIKAYDGASAPLLTPDNKIKSNVVVSVGVHMRG